MVLLLSMVGVAYGFWSRSLPDKSCSSVVSKVVEPYYRVAAAPLSEVSQTSNHSHDALVDWSPRASESSEFVTCLPAVANPLEFAELTAAVDGPLWRLEVSEGQQVVQGQLLGVIDNRVALASSRAAEAAADRSAMLRAARAKEQLARQYVKRIEMAASKNAASGLEVDEARGRLEEAAANVAEGEEQQREAVARLNVERARLEAHEIRAPFDGQVVHIRKRVGETTSKGESLFTIANVQRLKAEIHLPFASASDYRPGQSLPIQAELPQQNRIDASIKFIAPVMDAATRTIRLLVEIDNSDGKLPAGFELKVLKSP